MRTSMVKDKAKIVDAIYDVISLEEYYQNPSLYTSFTAINGNDGYLYPIRNRTDNRPGCYPTEAVAFFKPPAPSEAHLYSKQNIIDFKNTESLKEIIINQQRLAGEERSVLTTIDSVFEPPIGENDTPEMKALKQAIIDKHIDLDKYEPRFGPNYNNDKRLMRKESITFPKLRTICDALDIKVSLTLEDATPDVPNPIGRTINAVITGKDGYVEGEDAQ